VAPGKVKGPGGGPPDDGQIDQVKKVGQQGEALPAAPEGSRFADKLTSSAGTGRVEQTAQQAAEAGKASGSLTAHLAADLSAGKISPKAAIERVIEGVLEKQLGSDAPPPVREKLRAALETALADDPFLSEKIRGLGSV
jgi:hypothetical protein